MLLSKQALNLLVQMCNIWIDYNKDVSGKGPQMTYRRHQMNYYKRIITSIEQNNS